MLPWEFGGGFRRDLREIFHAYLFGISKLIGLIPFLAFSVLG